MGQDQCREMSAGLAPNPGRIHRRDAPKLLAFGMAMHEHFAVRAKAGTESPDDRLNDHGLPH